MGISSYRTEGGGYAFTIDLKDQILKEIKIKKDTLTVYLQQDYDAKCCKDGGECACNQLLNEVRLVKS